MNILIVDDDSYVIEALSKGMDWNTLNIDKVYTAYNVKNAKKILESVPIHIMLCDIEMPKENGLSLLRWVREKKILLQNIFLTSYEEFEYASQAIELQAFSYALKPISYEKLSEVIAKAVEKEKQALKEMDYQKGYQLWIDSEKNRKAMFWQKLLGEKTLLTMADMEGYLRENELKYNADDKFVCVTIAFFHYKKILSEIGCGMLEWIFENIAEEIFAKPGLKTEGILRTDKAVWVLVLQTAQNECLHEIKEMADLLLQKLVQHFHSPARCGIGNVCILMQLSDNLKHIRKMCEDNVICENSVFMLNEYERKDIAYLPPNFTLWESLLSEHKVCGLTKAMEEYLNYLVNYRKINKQILYQFMMDTIQMIFAVLKKKHVMLKEWQYEYFNSEMTEEATSSVENMRTYLEDIIEKTTRAIKSTEENKSVADIIKEYIDDNIEKEMTRESLAELVYLNPDYLARLFKKEVGESLVSYITNRRIALAKDFFITTNEPVNVVAAKVGYDNFSYFSKVFKDVTGLTPKDYKSKFEEDQKIKKN